MNNYEFSNNRKVTGRNSKLYLLIIYDEDDLIVRINVTKSYPLVQINAALNQLVEDKNEYITDKYFKKEFKHSLKVVYHKL